MADPVDYKEFAQALANINSNQVTLADGMRLLIIKSIDELRQDNLAQHTSLRRALDEQDKDIAGYVKQFFEEFKKHTEEKEELKTRVTILEETQKRIIWLGITIVPSVISLWEIFRTKVIGQ